MNTRMRQARRRDKEKEEVMEEEGVWEGILPGGEEGKSDSIVGCHHSFLVKYLKGRVLSLIRF